MMQFESTWAVNFIYVLHIREYRVVESCGPNRLLDAPLTHSSVQPCAVTWFVRKLKFRF